MAGLCPMGECKAANDQFTMEAACSGFTLSVVRIKDFCFHFSEAGPHPAPGSALRGPALDQHQVFDEGF